MCIAIKEKLDKLAELQARLEQARVGKQKAVDAVLAPVQSELTRIEEQYAGQLTDLEKDIAFLDADVRSDVLNLGESVKATFLHAVWAKGRVSWDDKGLMGYAVVHPDVLAFRGEGKPSVSLRKVELKEAK